MNFIEKTRLSERTIFWIIILSSIVLVVLMASSLEFYKSQDKRAKATLAAIPTMTAESLEFLYEKGVGYINIKRWQQAKMTLELVFETDPNYRDVQAKLIEIDAQIARLDVVSTPTLSSNQPLQTEASIDNPNLNPTPIPADIMFSTESIAPTNGLIAYYPFNGNPTDESGSEHHATNYGVTLTTDRFGEPGRAYNFDGVNAHMVVSHDQALALSNSDFSLSAWIYQTARNVSYQDVIIYRRGDGSADGWGLSVTGLKSSSIGIGKLFYIVSGGYDPFAISSKEIMLNHWHHVLITYDRNDQTVKMYIDGDLDTLKENIPPPNPSTISALFIGKDSAKTTDGYHFHGVIDDIRIYDHVLSEEEVEALYYSEQ